MDCDWRCPLENLSDSDPGSILGASNNTGLTHTLLSAFGSSKQIKANLLHAGVLIALIPLCYRLDY